MPTRSTSSTPRDFDGLEAILSGIARNNKQVLFEGNGYSPEWHAEAERRGLPNNKTTVEALPALATAKAKAIFSKFGVLSERELAARVEIGWERYVKVGNIEANSALDIARTMIMPAAVRYLAQLAAAGTASRAAASATTSARRSTSLATRSTSSSTPSMPRTRRAPSRTRRRPSSTSHPGPDRAARGRGRARDARRRRPVAAAQVPRAALPVLSRSAASLNSTNLRSRPAGRCWRCAVVPPGRRDFRFACGALLVGRQ